MKSCLMLNCLKFHHIIHDTTASMHQQVPWKNDILGSWLIVCCKLPPTLARQMWRHHYVIDRNEYLISTLSESTFPWVYSLQFLLKSFIIHGDMKENVSGCFFLNTVYFHLTNAHTYNKTRTITDETLTVSTDWVTHRTSSTLQFCRFSKLFKHRQNFK